MQARLWQRNWHAILSLSFSYISLNSGKRRCSMQWNVVVLLGCLPFSLVGCFSSCRWKMTGTCSTPWTMATQGLRTWSSWWSFTNSTRAFSLASWNITVLELHFSQTRSDLLNLKKKDSRKKKLKKERGKHKKGESIAMVKRISFTSKLQ